MNLERMKSLDRDDMLNLLGLETKRNTVDYLVPALALFGVGVLVGTGVGLLVAQRPGKELRQSIATTLQHAPEAMSHLPQRASDAVSRMSDQITDALHDGKASA